MAVALHILTAGRKAPHRAPQQTNSFNQGRSAYLLSQEGLENCCRILGLVSFAIGFGYLGTRSIILSQNINNTTDDGLLLNPGTVAFGGICLDLAGATAGVAAAYFGLKTCRKARRQGHVREHVGLLN